MSRVVWKCIGSAMRPWLLSAVVPLLVLGVGDPVAAQGRGGARFDGVGSGITHAPGDRPSTFLASTEGGRDRPARVSPSGERAGQAPAAGHRGFDYRGLRMTPPGLEILPRGSLPGGATLLPPDLRSMPQPIGNAASSDRPSPRISVRENGAVLGLSYKIKPPQQ